MDLTQFDISLGSYDNKTVIWIAFQHDSKLMATMKTALPKAKWSQAERKWYVADQPHTREVLGLEPSLYEGKQVLSHIHLANRPAYTRMQEELRLKGYSESTLRTYSIELAQLLYLLDDFPVEELRPEKVRDYILYCISELQLSENQIHSRLNALKFYFEQVLKREKFFVEIPRPQKPSKLPKVLSTTEIRKIFEVTTNEKHKLMLQMSYGMGLRVSEIVHIRIADIDSNRMLLHIQGAKGKKDRYVPLSESILPKLRTYYIQYSPKEFLFEGQNGGPYAIRSVQSVFKTALVKAKIRKKIGIHGLRHSYATHLLEYGTDMSFIQKLLGHNDIKTTEIYAKVSETHLSKVKSPLDRL